MKIEIGPFYRERIDGPNPGPFVEVRGIDIDPQLVPEILRYIADRYVDMQHFYDRCYVNDRLRESNPVFRVGAALDRGELAGALPPLGSATQQQEVTHGER